MTSLTKIFSGLVAVTLLAGCQTDSRDQVLAVGQSSVALRSMQSRVFDTTDKLTTMRTIIATMQDLGFIVDKADDVLGTVSGTKLDGYMLKMTVTVRERGETQMVIRANAQYNITPVEEPGPYQQFFAALEKAMFLTAHQID